MKKPAVLVDIDDTLADTQVEVLAYVNAKSPQPYEYAMLTRDFREGRADKNYDELVTEFLRDPKLIDQAKPYRHALTGLQRLHRAGYEIHIASARKENLHSITLEWLKRHGLFELVTQVHPRASHIHGAGFKLEAAATVNVVAAFDDTYDVAEALADAGVLVYLIERPWNQAEPEHPLITPSIDFGAAVEHFLESTASRSSQSPGSHRPLRPGP